MRLEVVNTGDELLLGHCLNSHLAYFGRQLSDLGLRIARQTCVPDSDEAIAAALAEAVSRSEVVLVTGGLGPTSDDRTLDVVSGVLRRGLSEDPAVLESIRRRMAASGREVTAGCRRQARALSGAEVLPNAFGTAPGHYLPATPGSPHVFLLPGPPRELHPMFEEAVVPRLRALLGPAAPPAIKVFKLFGVGESAAAAAVDTPLAAVPGLSHGYQVDAGYVNVRLTGSPGPLAAGGEVVQRAFGDAVVSDDGRTLEQVVVARLAARGETVATAESCTGGLIASTLTDVPGASDVFRRGLVTYANTAKVDLLGIDPALIDTHGAVSAEVAEAMVRGCLERSGDDHAIAVTGVAGPAGGSPEKPVGTVFIAVGSKGRAAPEVLRCFYPHERAHFKTLTCRRALDILRRRLGC
jgi:nicotinamide-nucleotide amidase